MMSLAELRRAVAIVDRDLRRRARRQDRAAGCAARGAVAVRPAAATRICCSASSPRARGSRRSRREPPAPPTPPGFAQLLRARIGGARLARRAHRRRRSPGRAALRRRRRRASSCCSRSSARAPTSICSTPRDACVGALRPLAETRRDLALGAPWKSPASKPPSEGEDRCADVARRRASSRRSRRSPPSARARRRPTRCSAASIARCAARSRRSRRRSSCCAATRRPATSSRRCASRASC